jgi:hypothetical protein
MATMRTQVRLSIEYMKRNCGRCRHGYKYRATKIIQTGLGSVAE